VGLFLQKKYTNGSLPTRCFREEPVYGYTCMYRILLATSFALAAIFLCLPTRATARAAESPSERQLSATPASLTGIDAAIGKPIAMRFLETPLRDALMMITDASGVTATADVAALSDAGYDLDQTVLTFQTNGEPFASSLDAICELLELEWIVRDDDIEFTTPEGAALRHATWVVNVTDITETPESLANLIKAALHPGTWDCDGGSGAIETDTTRDARALVVSQSWQVRRSIAGLLDRIRIIVASPDERSTPLAAEGYWSDATAAVAARKTLATAQTLDCSQVSLRDVATYLSDKTDAPISFDWPALESSGIDVDVITADCPATKMQLARSLDRTLEPLELDWEIRHDRIQITTRAETLSRMSVAAYPIAHLLSKGRDATRLVATLQAAVTPAAWLGVGGNALIEPFRSRSGVPPCLLIIRHTSAGHRAVDAFLRSLP
jgi:hypothetical protein